MPRARFSARLIFSDYNTISFRSPDKQYFSQILMPCLRRCKAFFISTSYRRLIRQRFYRHDRRPQQRRMTRRLSFLIERASAGARRASCPRRRCHQLLFDFYTQSLSVYRTPAAAGTIPAPPLYERTPQKMRRKLLLTNTMTPVQRH